MRWTSGTRVLQDAVPRIAIALFSAIPAAAPAASVCFASEHGGDKRRSDTPIRGIGNKVERYSCSRSACSSPGSSSEEAGGWPPRRSSS